MSYRISSLFFLSFVLLSFVSAQSKPFAIVGARVVIGDGRTLDAGTILVREGRVTAVGSDLSPEADMEIVEGKGMVVYPGFIDAYSGRYVKFQEVQDKPEDIASTAPTQFSLNRPNGVFPHRKNVESAHYEKDFPLVAHRQGFTAGLSTSAQDPFGGLCGVLLLTPEEKKPKTLTESFAQEMSYRRASNREEYPRSPMGASALVRQTLLDAKYLADHLWSGDVPEDARLNPKNLQPLYGVVLGNESAIFYADSAREIERALRLSDEFGLRLILAGAREAYEYAPILLERSISVLLSVAVGPEPARSMPANSDDPRDILPEAVWGEKRDEWEKRAKNALALHEAGVPFAFGSDGDELPNFLANVRRIVNAGLPADVALQALTSNTSQLLDVSSQLGTISPGKLANFTIFDGDWLDEESRVTMIVVEGNRAAIPSKEEEK